MKVTISVGGKFHAFDLAAQLERRGLLGRLITSYPKFETRKYGIPKNKTTSLILREFIERGFRRSPSFLKRAFDHTFFINDMFDRMASNFVPEHQDIFVGWSSEFLYASRRAKRGGAVTIVERGSTHIEYQDEVLRDEYGRAGIEYRPVHPRVLEKEIKEYEEADYISIPSSFVERTFTGKGIASSKLIKVPYGVDLSRFRQVLKEDDVFRVIFAGGMSIRKGVHYLLRAFSELRLPNAELMLIGSMNEEMRPFFKRYNVAKSSKEKNATIYHVGHVPQAELYKYYSQGSVFVIMSVEEGLALVQPQAMACGLPVVATVATGAEDIVRDGEDGFVIPVGGVEELKEKLTYFYENPEEQKRMGRSARRRVSSGFTWDDYGDRMVSEYGRIVGEEI